MKFTPMRQQVVREGIFRVRDALEADRQPKVLLGVSRVALTHGAIRRHDADFFVQRFPR
jgi:hypothetical protein